MALKGKLPNPKDQRLKCFFYGAAGVGKTMAAMGFPKCYFIDTERGADKPQYIEKLRENGSVLFQTSNFDEVIDEVRALMSTPHDYTTLVIDPLTILYNDLLDQASMKLDARGGDGTAFGRHYQEANKQMKRLIQLLLKLDMNVILTAHAKNEYGANMSVLGQTFDCYKKIDYVFDLVFEIKKLGETREGIVKKSRISQFKEGERFPFSYEEIAKRYGREIMEKSVQVHELPTQEDLDKLFRLMVTRHVPEEIKHKWLEKSQVARFEDMPRKNVLSCIGLLESKGE